MKRLVKKSGIENISEIKNIIESLLNKGNVKEYILNDVAEYARSEFEFNNDLDADDVYNNYREALLLDMSDIVEFWIDDIIELFQNADENISEEKAEEFAYSKDFTEVFADELYSKYDSSIIKTIDDEKEDADEMYGN